MFVFIFAYLQHTHNIYIIYTFLNAFSDLLVLYGQLYLKPSGKINRVLVARIIHTLTRGYCYQTDGLSSDMFTFFSRAMQYARYVTRACFVC